MVNSKTKIKNEDLSIKGNKEFKPLAQMTISYFIQWSCNSRIFPVHSQKKPFSKNPRSWIKNIEFHRFPDFPGGIQTLLTAIKNTFKKGAPFWDK